MPLNELPRPLATIAREHRGLVTRRRALAARVTPSLLDAALRSGQLHRLRPGIFCERSVWDGLAAHDRYTLTVRGVLLDRPGWLASHHAGAALAGLPLFGVDLGLVDIVADVRTSKRRSGTHVHRATPNQLARMTDPTFRTVDVADACVLTAVGSGFEPGVVAMDAAVKRRLATPAELSDSLEACAVRYGVAQARDAIATVDPACESPGETRVRLVLTGAGLDVRSQVSLSDDEGFIGRVDFLVGDRVVVEFDGAVKYDGIEGRRALMEEKRREERLRDAGFHIVRVTWAELAKPAALVTRVRGLLAAA